jgi:hypothetical protein
MEELESAAILSNPTKPYISAMLRQGASDARVIAGLREWLQVQANRRGLGWPADVLAKIDDLEGR